MLPKCSLVISTYNWPEALELCLLSVLQQSRQPDEIVIADDGSADATKNLVELFKSRTTIPIRHVWHEDTGFRLAAIRNKANAAAAFEYIIQIDGDLVLHPDFVKDHVEAARPGYFIGGSRTLMSPELSAELLRTKQTRLNPFTAGVSNKLNGMHSGMIGKLLGALVRTANAYNIRGCNMSYWKKDFIAVNGYDEHYKGWGREDTDLVFRFYHAGFRRTYFKLRGVVYHIWHKEADRDSLLKNDSILEATIREKKTNCALGVAQYL